MIQTFAKKLKQDETVVSTNLKLTVKLRFVHLEESVFKKWKFSRHNYSKRDNSVYTVYLFSRFHEIKVGM